MGGRHQQRRRFDGAAADGAIPDSGLWRLDGARSVALGYLLLLPFRRAALVWAAVPAILALVLWVRPTPSLTSVPPGGALLAVREGPMATASVVDDASGARYLEVNGHFRMGGTSSVRSDYRQAMLPLLLHPAPHRALFLGVGTGATVVGGSQMPGVTVRGVELSREVVELLPWFANPRRHPTPGSPSRTPAATSSRIAISTTSSSPICFIPRWMAAARSIRSSISRR